ncbi:MAG: putative Zn-binding protein involved in type VI secretion, partial [Myxococcota bacterium]
AVVTSQSLPCMLPGCVPGGPGMIAKGSATVMVMKLPAARMNDMTVHTSCVAPIPGPVGKVMPPCCPTVMIGG